MQHWSTNSHWVKSQSNGRFGLFHTRIKRKADGLKNRACSARFVLDRFNPTLNGRHQAPSQRASPEISSIAACSRRPRHRMNPTCRSDWKRLGTFSFPILRATVPDSVSLHFHNITASEWKKPVNVLHNFGLDAQFTLV